MLGEAFPQNLNVEHPFRRVQQGAGGIPVLILLASFSSLDRVCWWRGIGLTSL